MFLLTPPSPSRTKAFQQSINEGPQQARFTEHSRSHSDHQQHTKFNAENLPPLQRDPAQVMTTSHRGLDHGLPPGTILPDPMGRQSQPQPPQHAVHGSPPVHQSSPYDSEGRSRPWQYQAKSEEERRRQEEERRRQEELKVRQEELRLDQRKTEERMLRESIANGVHPNLIPLIFVGLGAGNTAGSGFEMAQQYIRQFQQVGQQVQSTLQQSSSPDLRRDLRISGQPQYGALQQQHPQTAQYGPHGTTSVPAPAPAPAQQAANVYPSPAYQSPPGQTGSLVSSTSRFPVQQPAATAPHNQSNLPRLTTNEAHVQYAAPAQPLPPNVQAQAQPPHQQITSTPNVTQQDGASPSPNIYFHHWQPPATTSNSTPSGRDSQKVSPKNTNSSADPSPRKRKAQGPHQAVPAPSSGLSRTSPAMSRSSSTSSRRGEHQRNSPPSKESNDGPSLQKHDSSKSDLRDESTRDSRAASPTANEPPPSSSEVQSSKDPESRPNT